MTRVPPSGISGATADDQCHDPQRGEPDEDAVDPIGDGDRRAEVVGHGEQPVDARAVVAERFRRAVGLAPAVERTVDERRDRPARGQCDGGRDGECAARGRMPR